MYLPFIPSNFSYLIFGNNLRQIAGIVLNVVIREVHDDELTITDHPVGNGAPITDHAFKNPESVMLEFGWSNNFIVLNALLGGSIFSGASNARLSGRVSAWRGMYADISGQVRG
jgi:hypothetical protein